MRHVDRYLKRMFCLNHFLKIFKIWTDALLGCLNFNQKPGGLVFGYKKVYFSFFFCPYIEKPKVAEP